MNHQPDDLMEMREATARGAFVLPRGKHGKAFMELANAGECRWPFGDPRDLRKFRFCGEKAREGHTYCAVHENVAYPK